MVFKRRDRRPLWKIIADFLWPKGGWKRAFYYVRHRLRRLPDPPHRIARGIFAGIFVTFTPFFGLHFVIAALVARLINGNLIAALLATFFGNPLTFPLIITVCLKLGHFLLGMPPPGEVDDGYASIIWEAIKSVFWNIWASFTDATADWSQLAPLYHEIFVPYLVGGLIPGIICGAVGYYISLPLIEAYKNRRKGMLKAKLEAIKEKARQKADAHSNQD